MSGGSEGAVALRESDLEVNTSGRSSPKKPDLSTPVVTAEPPGQVSPGQPKGLDNVADAPFDLKGILNEYLGELRPKPNVSRRRLPLDVLPEHLSSTGTTAEVSTFTQGNKEYVLKELRRKSRILSGVSDYTKVSREDYIRSLGKVAAYERKLAQFMVNVFGSDVLPPHFFIGESVESDSEGKPIPTIMIIQDRVKGKPILWVERDGKLDFTYEEDAGNPEAQARHRAADPNYQKILKRLEQITQTLQAIGRGDYSQLSEQAREFLVQHPESVSFIQQGIKKGFKILPFDLHRQGNILVDSEGNVRIVDW